MKLSILYRGPLESCNYGCAYCPFAKKRDTPEELAADRAALERFVGWVAGRPDDSLAVFFTPWGEALVRPWYQDALARLTALPHVRRAAVQTNLSARLDWLSACEPSRLGVWATYHPEWTTRRRFLRQVAQVREAGAHLSVGVVGYPRFREEVAALRRELPEDVYLWVNAVKRPGHAYTEEELAFFSSVDPLFHFNTRRHPSLGRACAAGHTVLSVDGDGVARRCHFIEEPIGNIYAADFAQALEPRPCTNATCGCHIGYVHLEYLELGQLYGAGILERVPASPVWQKPAAGLVTGRVAGGAVGAGG
jgi:MoaA/NifB/PqqE/SkfB family radical SAM enzyme